MLPRRVDGTLQLHVSFAHIVPRTQQQWRGIRLWTTNKLESRTINKNQHSSALSRAPDAISSARSSPSASSTKPSLVEQLFPNAGTSQSMDSVMSSGESLVDQLFPNTKELFHGTAATRKPPTVTRELPPLPLDFLVARNPRSKALPPRKRSTLSRSMPDTAFREARKDMVDLKQWTRLPDKTPLPFLQVDNASKNLTTADFRRLIPKAKLLQGWALAQADIIDVVPGRFINDLSTQATYYLYFKSAFAAQKYKEHVLKVREIVREYCPLDGQSRSPVPPGYVVNGIDVASAIASYAVGSPHQNFSLNQLVTPLSDHTTDILAHGGPEVLFKRPDRMPFELRLVLEGSQIHMNTMRVIFMTSSSRRGMPWSGDEYEMLRISRWEATTRHMDEFLHSRKYSKPADTKAWATEAPVYVVGFSTKSAAQSFLHYWHKRPIASATDPIFEHKADRPPIVNLEMLW